MTPHPNQNRWEFLWSYSKVSLKVSTWMTGDMIHIIWVIWYARYFLKETRFYGSIKTILFRHSFLYQCKFGITTENKIQKNWKYHFSKFFKYFWESKLIDSLWNHYFWLIEEVYRAIFQSFVDFIDQFSKSWDSQETYSVHLIIYLYPTISDASKTFYFSILVSNSLI